jgi:hypothetical protein
MRDYSGNIQASDRNWYYLNSSGQPLNDGGGEHPSLEYDARPSGRRPGPNVAGVVYGRTATSITLSVTFYNGRNQSLSGTLTWQAARLRVPAPNPPTGQTTPEWEYINLSVAPSQPQSVSLGALGGTQTFSLTLSGVPQHVLLGALELKYNLPLQEQEGLQGNNGSGGNFHEWEWVYKVAATPIGLQAKPWTDFLNYTCRWAYGSTDETSLRENMTTGMHYSRRSRHHRLRYDPRAAWQYFKLNSSGGYTKYKLKKFTTNLDQLQWEEVDCHHFAQYLRLSMASHGATATAEEFQAIHQGQEVDMLTNKLCLAGLDSTILSNYTEETFNVHVVTIVNSSVFDASSSYLKDWTGSNFMNPPANWQTNSWWQNVVSGVPCGLVKWPIGNTYDSIDFSLTEIATLNEDLGD